MTKSAAKQTVRPVIRAARRPLPRRAAILIGVCKTGNLPKLNTAVDCAKRMGAWARSQGFPKSLVKVITDEKSPVTARQIKAAVNTVLKDVGVEQVIVYFSGH